jgi:hypothetical protein
MERRSGRPLRGLGLLGARARFVASGGPAALRRVLAP